MNREPAPWPIIAGLVALAAAAVWVATVATYDVAAAFAWLTAAGSAYAAAHMTAEHIVNRISTRGENQ